ncbi:hypothetical protein GCM10010910_28300 [Microbacterium nanhaiense]|uniref:Amidohydrolase-related domain-containing protein n=1 Tax=Microbacterium nanhaiense TaxID=1301026 RepID=A0ABQ2N4R2_9MICO|nr:amidohydrolase family protein [Microbacterium nanhaiense]GGO67158.1 hypothetical protein GCM10010910_28300 [Microbacterium nanhaiense]
MTPEFVAGARTLAAEGLAFDACVRWTQLADAAALAAAAPELRIVLDHVGKLPVSPATRGDGDVARWADGIRRIAERPRVHCKLSGLPAESSDDWTGDALTPFLDVALEAFGPDRLIYGSDWPVSGPGAAVAWIRLRVGRGCQTETGCTRRPAIPPSTSMAVPVVEPDAGLTR